MEKKTLTKKKAAINQVLADTVLKVFCIGCNAATEGVETPIFLF